MNSKRQVNTIKTVLERKWKSIKYTFNFGGQGRDELPVLFSDFQQYLKNTIELEEAVKQLSKKNIIPNNFFKRDFIKVEQKEFMSSPYRDDIQLIGRIYIGILNEIDMQILHPVKNIEISKKEIKIHKFPVKDTGTDSFQLDLKNEQKKYLDEKELFILYSLLKNKHVSTMWSNLFVPDVTEEIRVTNTGDDEKNVEDLEQQINKNLERVKSKRQSALVVSYLLELGKMLDEKDFSIYCNADYSLVEGGFLSEYLGDTMIEYSNDTEENRKNAKKYKILNKEQLKFMDEVIQGKDFDSIKFSHIANLPIKEYQEAILNKKADKDFIELVNKLITKHDGSKWDKNDVAKFLEIWYRHNKEKFQNELQNLHNNKKVNMFSEDIQTKLAGLIFEHMDVHLDIKNTKKLEHYFFDYINLFKNDKLNGFSGCGLTRSFFRTTMNIPLNTKFFGFKKQKDILLKHIENVYQKFQRSDLEIGDPYVKPEYIGDTSENEGKFTLSEPDEEKELFLFVHTMIALEYEKQFEVEGFSYGTTAMFDLYDRGFLFKIRLENKPRDKTLLDKVLYSTPKSKALAKSVLESRLASLPDLDKRIEELENKKSLGKKMIVRFKEGDKISIIEILKKTGRIKVYINGDYNHELDFSRKDGKYWDKMYALAENGFVDFNKGFFNYFNSNDSNPLYAKHGLIRTKILKQEDGTIVPNNIEIKLIGKKKVTQRLQKA